MEKERLEERMRADADLLKILRALQETDREDIVQEERARRQAARESRVNANLEDMPVEGEHARVGVAVNDELSAPVLTIYNI